MNQKEKSFWTALREVAHEGQVTSMTTEDLLYTVNTIAGFARIDDATFHTMMENGKLQPKLYGFESIEFTNNKWQIT